MYYDYRNTGAKIQKDFRLAIEEFRYFVIFQILTPIRAREAARAVPATSIVHMNNQLFRYYFNLHASVIFIAFAGGISVGITPRTHTSFFYAVVQKIIINTFCSGFA